MPSIQMQVRLKFLAGFSPRARMPPIDQANAVDEMSTIGPLDLEHGVTNADIPGIGSGAIDITTLQFCVLIVYGVVTLRWNGADLLLQGSISHPAIFLISPTSTTTVPQLTNTSGATVQVYIAYGGT